ncbi:hypothetical protein QJS64_13830 [Paraclostridium bifermentans]|uniref:Uncharacterized protein n=1 Tax=Paraclostridium bifermentans TaxID=1490 RepID=A0ABY8R2B1_PARBF|nr:hypothetical protein QJS64_13830 [Paraclostridium bifermentans]
MTSIFGGSGIWFTTLVSEAIVLVIARKILQKNKSKIQENEKYEDAEIYENAKMLFKYKIKKRLDRGCYLVVFLLYI